MVRIWSKVTLAASLLVPSLVYGQHAVLSVPASAHTGLPVIASTVGSDSDKSVAVCVDPASAEPNLALVPIATPDGKGGWSTVGYLVSFPFKGNYRLVAIASKGTNYAVCSKDISVDTPTPIPPVPPVPPIPPVPPVPPIPPVPPQPTQGLGKVIFIYESSSPMTQQQVSVLYSNKLRAWMDANVNKDKTTNLAAWRFWDKDAVVSDTLPDWKMTWDKVKSAAGSKLPAIAIVDNGGNVATFDMPTDEQATIDLLNRYK